MKHFSILDWILTILTLTIISSLIQLAYNDYLNSDYIGSGLYIACVFGLIWLVYGWIKEAEKETKKKYRKARW